MDSSSVGRRFSTLCDGIATGSKKPAHDRIFDQTSDVVWIQPQAAHRVGQAALILEAKTLFEAAIKQTFLAKNVFQAAEQTIQRNDPSVAHRLAP
jgi:hypothetical protein